jgi:hypothetical protein
MASALTSSTSSLRGPALAGLLLGVVACAAQERRASDEDDLRLAGELDALTKKVQTVNYGPTVRAGGAFEDRTEALGLAGLQAVALNAVDLDRDGRADLAILPTYYSRPRFFLWNDRAARFERWDHDPLPEDFKASFMVFADLNRDRIPDLLSGVLNQRSEVSQIPVKYYAGRLEQGKLRFAEVADALKLPAEPTSGLTVVDYDLDGWPDVFVSNWFENRGGQYLPVADRLLRNREGKKFEDVTALLLGEADKAADQLYPPNARPTYGAATCDVDQNGWPDILTVSSSGHKNKLWMNLKDPATGERFFEDIGPVSNYASDPDGSLIPTGGGRSFFSACTDYNDDGLMDVFLGELSHAYDNDSVDRSSILTGSRETYPPFFLRTEYVSDAYSEGWNQGDRRGVWADFNLDGRVDLLVDNSGFPPYSRLVLFEQDEARAFVNVAPQAGIDVVNPAATITLDVNRDGLPDILTAQNNIRQAEIPPRLYFFQNTGRVPGRRSLTVHLEPAKANTDGLGAMVMLYTQSKTGKVVQRRWSEYSQGGLPSQNEAGVRFGIPEGVEAVGVKVRWPYRKTGTGSDGAPLEKLYPLKGLLGRPHTEVTVSEDGSIR